MSIKEELEKLIESVEVASEKPLYLVAYSDVAEQKYREWYPEVEIIRVPLKMDGNKK